MPKLFPLPVGVDTQINHSPLFRSISLVSKTPLTHCLHLLSINKKFIIVKKKKYQTFIEKNDLILFIKINEGSSKYLKPGKKIVGEGKIKLVRWGGRGNQ